MSVYENFKETNDVWTWIDTEDGFEFKNVVINNAVAGDTDSIMLEFPTKSIDGLSSEEIVDLADEIASLTNETFPEFVKFAFNAPEERKHSIETDREIVSDKSLFLSRKRYIMHVVNDEGKWVDKKKIMGVELKKSNVSEFTKHCLNEIVDMILDDKSKDEVKSIIRTFKAKMKEFDLKEIGVPSGCKTLKKATDQFEATGSMKGIHISAKSALVYNLRCGVTDKKIMPGEKVLNFYIKDAKSKSIALPMDVTNTPNWFDDIVIDYNVMWEKVNDTIENYLEAMEWDIKSQKASVTKELFDF